MYNLLANETAASLRSFFQNTLPSLAEDWWPRYVVSSLTFQQQRRVEEVRVESLAGLDLAALIRVLDQNWYEINNKVTMPREARNYVKETQTIRNRWAHRSGEGVPLTIKLTADEYLLFAHTDGTVGDANAVLSIFPFPPTIRIATGAIWCYPKRIMADLCHEWRHLQQFFDEGLLFKAMASEEEYFKDPLEIEATEFSKKVMKEYLLAVGNKA